MLAARTSAGSSPRDAPRAGFRPGSRPIRLLPIALSPSKAPAGSVSFSPLVLNTRPRVLPSAAASSWCSSARSPYLCMRRRRKRNWPHPRRNSSTVPRLRSRSKATWTAPSRITTDHLTPAYLRGRLQQPRRCPSRQGDLDGASPMATGRSTSLRRSRPSTSTAALSTATRAIWTPPLLISTRRSTRSQARDRLLQPRQGPPP